MYQTLWNSINKQVKNSHASAAFLAVSLMGWTTIGLLAGFLICMIGGMSFVTKVTVVEIPVKGWQQPNGGVLICTDIKYRQRNQRSILYTRHCKGQQLPL